MENKCAMELHQDTAKSTALNVPRVQTGILLFKYSKLERPSKTKVLIKILIKSI